MTEIKWGFLSVISYRRRDAGGLFQKAEDVRVGARPGGVEGGLTAPPPVCATLFLSFVCITEMELEIVRKNRKCFQQDFSSTLILVKGERWTLLDLCLSKRRGKMKNIERQLE